MRQSDIRDERYGLYRQVYKIWKICKGLQITNVHASLDDLYNSKLSDSYLIRQLSLLVSKIGVKHQIPTSYEVPTASRAYNMHAAILRRDS